MEPEQDETGQAESIAGMLQEAARKVRGLLGPGGLDRFADALPGEDVTDVVFLEQARAFVLAEAHSDKPHRLAALAALGCMVVAALTEEP